MTHTTVFPKFDAEKRTDEGFRSGKYADHRYGETPLTDLSINMIEDFPVGDELHHVDLGVTKRLLNSWKDGVFGHAIKWSTQMKQDISAFLKSVKKPAEIHRVIRGIDEMTFWKGTEYRTFLLYCSIVVLRKFLPTKYYQHFLLYFCSITICSSDFHITDMLETAESMLKVYLDLFMKLYGSEHIVSNIHNLCHLVDEVRKFGRLITFSSYPFESKLHSIKQDLRSGHLPLAQVVKRQIEKEFHENVNEKPQIWPILKKQLNKRNPFGDSVLSNTKYSFFSEIQFPDFAINISEGNNYILTTDHKIIMTKLIVHDALDNMKYIYGSVFEMLDDFFEIPFPSRVLQIYITNSVTLPSKLYPIECIKAKMFSLKYAGDYNDDDEDEEELDVNPKIVFVPLIHTLK